MHDNYDAIGIGSGFGGLTAGALFAHGEPFLSAFVTSYRVGDCASSCLHHAIPCSAGSP